MRCDQTVAWAALQQHARAFDGFDLRKAFAQDAQRVHGLSQQAPHGWLLQARIADLDEFAADALQNDMGPLFDITLEEALAYLVGQAEKTKDEIGRVLSEEVRGFLQSDKLREEFLKLL